MKLSELLKMIDAGENVQVTALNDLGTDCVIKEGYASDLNDPESDEFKSGSWCGPTTEFLLGSDVANIHSKCVTESHDFSKEDDTDACSRMAFKATSVVVVRLELSIAKINEIRKKAWVLGSDCFGSTLKPGLQTVKGDKL